jgi:hypothetical protein
VRVVVVVVVSALPVFGCLLNVEPTVIRSCDS